jgi:hypothetical protein
MPLKRTASIKGRAKEKKKILHRRFFRLAK